MADVQAKPVMVDCPPAKPGTHGFGFFLCIAVGILVLFFGTLLYFQHAPPQSVGQAREAMALAAIRAQAPISSGLRQYQQDLDHWPATLDDLVNVPQEAAEKQHWHGPYLYDVCALIDPWGQPYRYRYPAKKRSMTYDLWSTGPDGIDGSRDDVVGGQ